MQTIATREVTCKAAPQFTGLDILYDRCCDLALRVASGGLPFIEAVDMAYSAAEWAGYVDAYGNDAVQQVLAAAFVGIPKAA